MLNAEENERISRVGPGTPMGAVMRRYWLPFLLSEQVPAPDCPPVRVRMLGERLVGFRDTSGRVGLLREACPHRKASLFFGRNEEDGLRCVYHGWKFDAEGRCTDMPSEPIASNFRDKVRLTAYPTQERAGVVWAYLGPADARPPLPDFEWMRVPDSHRAVTVGHQANNWLQALEGGIDSSHSSFLHNNDITDTRALRSRATPPELDVRRTSYGFTYASVRHLPEDEGDFVRVYHYVAPFHQLRATLLPGPGGAPPVPQISGHMWVPMDDENTLVFNWAYTYGDALLTEKKNYRGGKQAEPVEASVQGVPVYERRAENDYLIDREDQRTRTFTGIGNTTTQDRAVQETMGPIVDRSDEHLGTSDRAIIVARRLLLEATQLVTDGGTPPGVEPTYAGARAVEKVLPAGVDWYENLRAHIYEGVPV